MNSLLIESTISTPMIDFNGETGLLQIKGESYPENVSKFYSPVLSWIREYLENENRDMTVEFDIPYFNSSSSKILMMIMDLLEQGIRDGKKVVVKWLCEEENEIAIECGEELSENLNLLPFEIKVY